MKNKNLSWVGALFVFALLLWCTAVTPGKVADPVLVGGAAALQDALAVLLCPLKDAFAQQCADLLCVHVVSLPCAVAVPVYSIRIPRSTPGCKGRRVKNV